MSERLILSIEKVEFFVLDAGEMCVHKLAQISTVLQNDVTQVHMQNITKHGLFLTSVGPRCKSVWTHTAHD